MSTIFVVHPFNSSSAANPGMDSKYIVHGSKNGVL